MANVTVLTTSAESGALCAFDCHTSAAAAAATCEAPAAEPASRDATTGSCACGDGRAGRTCAATLEPLRLETWLEGDVAAGGERCFVTAIGAAQAADPGVEIEFQVRSATALSPPSSSQPNKPDFLQLHMVTSRDIV